MSNCDNLDISEYSNLLRSAQLLCDDHQFSKCKSQLEFLATKNIPEAYMCLGYIYEKGGDGIARNESTSLFYYKKYISTLDELAKMDNCDAIYVLAGCFQYGSWVEKDESRAVSLYLKAAERGHAESQFHLATLYMHGWSGLDISNEMSNYWLGKAADLNHPEALFMLGSGLLNCNDPLARARALDLIRKSADCGFWIAKEYLEKSGL